MSSDSGDLENSFSNSLVVNSCDFVRGNVIYYQLIRIEYLIMLSINVKFDRN